MLTKYFSTPTNKLTNSISSFYHITNSQAAKYIAAKKNKATIDNDNFNFDNHLNNLNNKNENQNMLPNNQ